MIASAAAVLLLAAAAGARAAAPSVDLSREGGAFRLRAGFAVDAPIRTVWNVLTDYDGMPRFLRSLRKSRVLERTDDGAIIEQQGSARLFVFSRQVALTLRVTEKPPARIEFIELGGGEFEEYEGAWTIRESTAGVSHVAYELFAEMKPSLVPRGVARKVIADTVRRQLEEVQAEIRRRSDTASR